MARRFRAWAVIVVVALVSSVAWSAQASGSSARRPTGPGSDPRQGVSSSTIKVGGIAGIENPIDLPYGEIYDGAEAYFDMINSQGGVNGRKIQLVKKRDDSSQPTRNLLQTRALVEEDGVFAVIPVAALYFTGSKYLTQKGVPAFGYRISNDWQDSPNLFGDTGSATCFTCVDPTYPWLAKHLGVSKVGVLGYNVAIAQDCTNWQVLSYHKYGVKTPYVNKALAFGFTLSSFAPDVEKIRKSGIQLLSTCQDSNGSLLAKEAINQAGINIPVQWGEGYYQSFLQRFGTKLDGLYLSITQQPFEDPMPSPGMALFKQWIAKHGNNLDVVTLDGWIVADLFVTGLKKIGKDVTRPKLINAINHIRDFSADGIIPGVDWTRAHHKDPTGYSCRAFVKVENGKFVPVFGQPGKPFVCLKGNAKSLDDFVIR